MAGGAVQAAQHATRRRSAHFLDVAAVPAQVLFLHTRTQAALPLKNYPIPTALQHTGIELLNDAVNRGRHSANKGNPQNSSHTWQTKANAFSGPA